MCIVEAGEGRKAAQVSEAQAGSAGLSRRSGVTGAGARWARPEPEPGARAYVVECGGLFAYMCWYGAVDIDG